MHRPTRLKITDVNPHLICVLCGGYLIDATTMIECLHSYCRACIVAYLRKSRQCPICDTVVHKTRPLLNIRSDKTLQNLVYKLVPNLFKDEMKRRRDFYAKHPQASTSTQSPNASEERGEVCEDSLVIYTEDEYISLSLDYYFPQPGKNEQRTTTDEGGTNGKRPNRKRPNGKRPNRDANGLPGDVVEKRFLRCPAAVCVSHIKKFIRNKFGLSPAHRIEVVHQKGEDEPLRDDYTLMDIAYIYTWRRNGPLPLLFRVFEPFSKRRKGSHSSTSSADSVSTKSSSQNPLAPPAGRPDGSGAAPSTAESLKGKRTVDFQKPNAKRKVAPETAQGPAKPPWPPSELPGPSRKIVLNDRKTPSPKAALPKAILPKAVLPKAVLPKAILPKAILPKAALPKQTDKTCLTDKRNAASANGVAHSSPIKTFGNTVVAVTSTNYVFTSANSVFTSANSVFTSANSTSTSAVTTVTTATAVKKLKVYSGKSSSIVQTNPKLPKPCPKTSRPSPLIPEHPLKETVKSSKANMTSSQREMTSSKTEMMSSIAAMTSSNAKMTSPREDSTVSKTDKSSAATLTPPVAEKGPIPLKANISIKEKSITASKTPTTPPKTDVGSTRNETVPSKVQSTLSTEGKSAKPNATVRDVNNTSEKPKVKTADGSDETAKTVHVPGTKESSNAISTANKPNELLEGKKTPLTTENNSSTSPKAAVKTTPEDGLKTQVGKPKVPYAESELVSAVKSIQSLSNTESSIDDVTAKATPTKDNHDMKPMEVSAPADSVVIDRPVLLQT